MSTTLLPRPKTLARLIELHARVAIAVRAVEADEPTTLEGILVAASETSVALHLHGVGDIEIPTSSLCAFRTVTALPPSASDADAPTPPPL
jgi:hypothetical protein